MMFSLSNVNSAIEDSYNKFASDIGSQVQSLIVKRPNTSLTLCDLNCDDVCDVNSTIEINDTHVLFKIVWYE